MNFKIAFFLLVLCSALNAQNFQSAKIGGGASTDYGYGMCIDNSGNIYVAGCYRSNAQFDNTNVVSAGFFDIFVAKYSSTGSLVWLKTAGGVGGDEAVRIVLDNEQNLYVSGTFEAAISFGSTTFTANGGAQAGEDIFLAKMNPDGDFLWAKQFGGTGQDLFTDMITNGQDVIISGYYSGEFTAGGLTLPPANGGTLRFYINVDRNGVPVWAKNSGGSGYLSVGNNNNFYMAGVFGGTASFDNVTFTSNGATDFYLGEYGFDGTQRWIKQFGGTGSELMRSICFDKVSGNIYWAGSFQNTMTLGSSVLTSSGQQDIFISKFDANGNNLWAKKAGGANYDVANSTAVDAQGNVYFTGYFMETATFNNVSIVCQGQGDAYVAKYNSNGDFQWVKGGGGAGMDNGMIIGVGNNSNVYFSGFTGGGATFGGLSLPGYGATDCILMKITDVVSVGNPNSVVKSFNLYQNYPNPFNPSTKISFDIVKSGAVKLSVTDINGKEIAELVSASMNAGSYEVNFNAENLSGGVYFYRLETANGVDTKKMILIK